MSAYGEARPKLDIGRVLREAFAVTGRNLPAFLALTVLLAGLPAAGLGALQFAAGAQRGLTLSGVAFFLAYAAMTVTQDAAVIIAAVGALRGRPVSLPRVLGEVLRRLPGLLALEVVYLFAFAAGLALLIVPGIMIALAWRAGVAVYVIERTSVIGALRRSAELTRGHRARILGLMLATGVASLVVWGGFVWLALLARVAGTAGGWAVVLVSNPLYYMLNGLMLPSVGAALYRDLRQLHDGVGIGGAADVFD